MPEVGFQETLFAGRFGWGWRVRSFLLSPEAPRPEEHHKGAEEAQRHDQDQSGNPRVTCPSAREKKSEMRRLPATTIWAQCSARPGSIQEEGQGWGLRVPT
jgi:hypothetical protein